MNDPTGFWNPIPRFLVMDAAMADWTKTNPAPEIVGYAYAWERRRASGAWPSRRTLAAGMGWSGWRARTVLERASADWDAWASGPRPAAAQPTTTPPASPAPVRPLAAQPPPDPAAARNRPAAAQPPPTDRPAQDVQPVVLEAPPPADRPLAAQPPPVMRADPEQDRRQETGTGHVSPSGRSGRRRSASAPAVPVSKIWDALNAYRLEAQPGARPLTLTDPRRRALAARVRDHGLEAVDLVWGWALTAPDKRAAFLRDGGYATPDTLFRPSKFGGYLDAAREWQAATAGASATTDRTASWDDFAAGD